MTRLRVLFPALVLAFSLTACKKEASTAPDDHAHHHEGGGGEHDESKHGDFEGREVVVNYAAKPGDITVCPVSGKKFEVKEDSPRLDWQGQSWVLCCNGCKGKIEAEPDKYLGPILEANPPAGDAAATDAAAGDATAPTE